MFVSDAVTATDMLDEMMEYINRELSNHRDAIERGKTLGKSEQKVRVARYETIGAIRAFLLEVYVEGKQWHFDEAVERKRQRLLASVTPPTSQTLSEMAIDGMLGDLLTALPAGTGINRNGKPPSRQQVVEMYAGENVFETAKAIFDVSTSTNVLTMLKRLNDPTLGDFNMITESGHLLVSDDDLRMLFNKRIIVFKESDIPVLTDRGRAILSLLTKD